MFYRPDTVWHYDVFPKVVPVGRPVDVTIRAISSHAFFGKNVSLRIIPINCNPNESGEPCPVHADEREIKFTFTFSEEEEYQLRIYKDGNDSYEALALYAVRDDLLELMPLIGDFHSHSCLSDGTEGPEFVASRYREEGYDFFALTDHRRYVPSVIAQKAYENLDLDFKIYRGEEVHSPDNPVHIVSFGTDEPVNVEYLTQESIDAPFSWSSDFLPEWSERVKNIEKKLPVLPDGVDPFVIASCMLISECIHKKGGMSIYAHPHWKCSVRNDPDSWSRYILCNGITDAFELVGGQSVRENVTQIAMYQEMRAEGNKIPIVGSSDQHGTCNVRCGEPQDPYRMFTEERTMVFAKNNSRDDIIHAVKELKSVALEQYEGCPCRVHGPYRLVQYALFLMNEYFPLQAELCREEGRLMRLYASGNKEVAEKLKSIDKETSDLRKKYFVSM